MAPFVKYGAIRSRDKERYAMIEHSLDRRLLFLSADHLRA
jgi:hypothetical protein